MLVNCRCFVSFAGGLFGIFLVSCNLFACGVVIFYDSIVQ